MANYQLLKADIDKKVYQNGGQEITGENLNSVLKAMVATLGAEYQFAGVATIETKPGTPDAKVFYIANGKGTYTNFGSLEVTEDEVVVLYWDSAWHKVATGIASQTKLTELEQDVATKQDALTLTIKDNGNIVIGNIAGQSQEFMPATPSGDPMHYAYVAAGAEYNDTGADIVKTTPWADMVDDDVDKTVIHKAGYWYLNGLGDITNEQMRMIFVGTNNILDSASNYISILVGLNIRTNIYNKNPSRHYTRSITNWSLLANQQSLEVLYFGRNDTYLPKPTNMGAMIRDCKNVFIIFCVFNCIDNTNFGAIADNATSLKYMWLKNIKKSINLQYCSQFANCCILYMIKNEAATSAITITLHAEAYARAMANADIVAALQAHPNVSLASA